MNLSRKILAALTSLALMVMMVGPVGSVQADEPTMEGLQTEVSSLKATIDQLTALIASLQTGATTPVSGGAITGVPTDFTFETDLELGASGDDVHYLQIVLNSDPVTQLATTGVGSPGEETSYFGPLTKAAVINFQEKYTDDVLAFWGLTSGTGYVGSTTRVKLNELLGVGPSAPVALSVLSVTPESDALDVAVDTEISAVFSDALDADTVTSDSVYLMDEDDQAVDGSVTYNSLAKKVTFAPTADLASGAEYVVVLTTDITSADGTALVEDASWVFTTEGVLIPSEITDAVACVTAGYEWFDDACHGEVAVVLPSEITDAVECVTAGYEWYSDACHAVDGEEAAVTGDPLTVALADDTPVGTLILSGSANNKVTKLVFTAADDADATVSGLTVKAYGTANLFALDIAAVKIFDGTKQVGLTQTQISGTSYFIFAPALSIPMGTSKVLDIAVDIAGATFTPSATVKLGIESATSISGTTFTAEFPVVGSSFTIAAGGALGTVNVTPGAPVPVNNVAIGQKDVVLGNFIVTAGTNEDIELTQFNVTYGGAAVGGVANASTAQDADITNVRVKIDGVVTGTAASFATRRASVDFSTPVPITKGTSKVFQVIGDISGAGRAIELSAEIGSIFGVGVISGQGVAGPAARFNLGAPSLVVFGPGRLAISVSTASPSGASANVVRSITPQILGVYDIRAVGEDILINTVNLQLADANGVALGWIANVGLYNEAGALLSNQWNYTAAQMTPAPVTQTYLMNWQIPANTTAKLYIKGTTNTLTTVAGGGIDTVNTQLAVVVGGTLTVIGTGMSSAGQAGPGNITSTSVLALPALTINPTATYLAVPEPTTSSYNQAIISPVAQVTLGYLKITAQNEDQTLNSMEITQTGVGNMNAILSGVALFDGTTPITVFNAPNNGTAACLSGAANVNRVCFLNADILTPLTFTLNTPKVLKVVGNVLALAPVEVDTLQLQVAANHLQTLGKTSGQFAINTGVGGVVGAVAIRTNIGAYNETGTFGLRTNVVEIARDAASPSGNVRGTFINHGIWDFTLNGTAANADIGSIVFTSQVGLPNVVGNPVTPAMFRLYDYTGSAVVNVIPAVDIAAGTVTFSNIPTAAITLTRGQVRKLSLQVTTTNVAAWPINTSLRWSIRSAASVQIGTVNTLVIAGDTDDANLGVLTAMAAGNRVRFTGADTVFNFGVDGLYFDADASGTISADDVRLVIGNAVGSGSDYGAGSVVVLADTDEAAPAAIEAANADALLATSAVGGAIFQPGVDAVYEDGGGVVANIDVNDIRVVPGNTPALGLNWAGATGYGGTTWSFPADANTVTL